MPRPENPLNAAEGPLAQFAVELRELRAKSELSYRQMAAKAHYSQPALSQAASGKKVPTWQVTSAYVRACDGDEAEWRQRWMRLQEQICQEKQVVISVSVRGNADNSDDASLKADFEAHKDSQVRKRSASALSLCLQVLLLILMGLQFFLYTVERGDEPDSRPMEEPGYHPVTTTRVAEPTTVPSSEPLTSPTMPASRTATIPEPTPPLPPASGTTPVPPTPNSPGPNLKPPMVSVTSSDTSQARGDH